MLITHRPMSSCRLRGRQLTSADVYSTSADVVTRRQTATYDIRRHCCDIGRCRHVALVGDSWQRLCRPMSSLCRPMSPGPHPEPRQNVHDIGRCCCNIGRCCHAPLVNVWHQGRCRHYVSQCRQVDIESRAKMDTTSADGSATSADVVMSLLWTVVDRADVS